MYPDVTSQSRLRQPIKSTQEDRTGEQLRPPAKTKTLDLAQSSRMKKTVGATIFLIVAPLVNAQLLPVTG